MKGLGAKEEGKKNLVISCFVDFIPRELFIRWLQLAAFFPAALISTPPWIYGPSVISTANNFSQIHQSLVIPLLQDKELRQQVSEGMPILRPVWWLDTGNTTVHEMKVCK